MEVGGNGFCTVIPRLVSSLVREITWKGKNCFGRILTNNFKTLYYKRKGMRNWGEMLGRVSWPTGLWKAGNCLMGQGSHLSLQILNIRFFGLDSVLPEGRGFERKWWSPSWAQIPWLKHGGSKKNIYHGWSAKESISADTVPQEIFTIKVIIPVKLSQTQWYLLRVPTAGLFFDVNLSNSLYHLSSQGI